MRSSFRRFAAYALAVGLVAGILWQASVLSRAQHERVVAQARFDLAVRGSQSGMWYWEPSKPSSSLAEQADDFVWYGPVFRRMLGYAEADFPNRMSSFLDRVHPDDKPSLDVAVAAALAGKGEVPFTTEYRLRNADGSYRWYVAKGAVNLNEDGEIVQMAGTIMPESGSREKLQMLYALFDVAPIALVVCDEERSVIVFNSAAEVLTGFTRRNIIGQKVEDLLIDEGFRDQHISAFTKTARDLALNPDKGTIVRPNVPGSLRRADGKVVKVLVTLRSARYDERQAFVAYIREDFSGK